MGTKARLKTRPTSRSVAAFVGAVADDRRRRECRTLLKLMGRVTGERPVMWGPGIVGFGRYHYRYDSGREGDWFVAGFSPRKQALTLYLMAGFSRYQSLLSRLGRHSTGKSCLYVKSLGELDMDVLEELVTESVRYVRTHGMSY